MANLENIRVVLVEPLYSGNVGSVCRAMANAGMVDLALVNPKRQDMNEARMMAVHATDILEDRTEYATLAEAVADCGAVMGTSCRGGLYRAHARTPRGWAPKALEVAETGKVALVFGREDKGLSNEELALSTQIITIPTTEEYKSLNLAQAVMVCCYEVFVAAEEFVPPEEKSVEAPSEVRERMFEIWKQTLFDIGFFKEDKSRHMMMGLRRVLSRGPLTTDDARIMMGIAKQAQWAAHNDPAAEKPRTRWVRDGKERETEHGDE